MRSYKKYLCIGFLLSTSLHGQIESPEDVRIGKSFPDLTLSDIQYYQRKNLSTGELKGKPFILFFWDRYCGSAFRYLSKMDKLAKQFEGRLEVIVVAGRAASFWGDDTPAKEVEALVSLYERVRKLQHLELPIAYDLDIFNKLVTRGVPHFVLVDEKGIVKAITADLDREKVELFLKGEDFSFKDYSFDGLKSEEQRIDVYDYNKLFLINNNGGVDNNFKYRSLITPYKNEMPMGRMLPGTMEDYEYWKKIEGVGALKDLYKLAYFGEYGEISNAVNWENYPKIIIELKDSLPFIDFRYNKPLRNVYWYSLVVPENRRNPKTLMRIMQNDLEDFFGYQAKIEKRKLPYWRISLSEKGKERLRSIGGIENIESDYYTLIKVTNLSLGKFLHKILYMVSPYGFDGIPILDATGGKLKVDIPMQEVDFSNFLSIKEVLEKLGFQVEKTYGKFNALVVY